MCISPITIKNPNYATAKRLHTSLSWLNEDTMYIQVPCGKCHECRRVREDNYIQRLQLEQFYNHIYFFTLTICDEALPHFATSEGDLIPVAPWDELTKMWKRLRKSNVFGHFRYFVLNEYGGKNHRPHFHGFILLRKDEFPDAKAGEKLVFDTLKEEWRKNVGTTFEPIWKPMFHYKEKYINGILNRTLDVSYVEEIGKASSVSNSIKYALKYTFKKDDYVEEVLDLAWNSSMSDEELRDFTKAFKPKIQKSQYLGSIYEPLTIHPKRWASRCTDRYTTITNPYNTIDGDMPDFEGIKFLRYEPVIEFYDVNEARHLELSYRPLIYNHIRSCVSFSAQKDYPCFLDPHSIDNDTTRPLGRYLRKFISCVCKDEDSVLYWKSKQYDRYGCCQILDERTYLQKIQTEQRLDRAYRRNLDTRDNWQDSVL